MAEFNPLQKIKREFFALRNGVIADTLRHAGSPFRIIFGLNMPQLSDIAGKVGYDSGMARLLWANTSTRESMLLAPMLLDPQTVTVSEAIAMVGESPSAEVTDVLCHNLLRKMPQAFDLACSLAAEEGKTQRYAAMRLLWQFLQSDTDKVLEMALEEVSRDDEFTMPLARQIVDEIDFLRGN